MVTCANSSTCVQYDTGKYVNIADLKATTYTNKACTTNSTIASGVSNFVRVGLCDKAGGETIHAKGFTTLLTVTAPGTYLCSYSDNTCNTLEKCRKYIKWLLIYNNRYLYAEKCI
eukprot:GHVR01114240.1.p1 GENE.GHVR01114240.1~~GHVR01114240.1.p1  ORF type:complete len:115 (-),score=1.80 GHVR01114240.1:490-834(-)